MSTFVPLQASRPRDWTPFSGLSARLAEADAGRGAFVPDRDGRSAPRPSVTELPPVGRPAADRGSVDRASADRAAPERAERSGKEELEARLAAAERALRESEARTEAARREAAHATREKHEAEQARAATEARVVAAERALTSAAAALTHTRQAVLDELRAGASAVILEAARRIAGEALHADPALLDRLVTEAAEALGARPTRLLVAPADVELLAARLPDVVVVADPSISAGCIAEGGTGRYDATVETAMTALTGVFAQWRAG